MSGSTRSTTALAKNPAPASAPLSNLEIATPPVGSASVSTGVKALYKNPPLLATEDADAYADNIRHLTRELSPGDVIGRLLVRDVIDSDFEVRRLRKFKAGLIELKRAQTIFAAENGHGEEDPHDLRKVFAHVLDDDCDEAHVDEAPQPEPPKPERNVEADTAQAFSDCMEAYERIDRLLVHALAMRKDALRLLDQHSEAARRRGASRTEVIDAECTDVPPRAPSGAA
jgi:hypothetical protein